MVKVTGAFQKSTEIMKASNQLIKLPQLSATMREMSAEMIKAGIMEEMMDDTMEGLDDDELEDEADEEVEKVLYQLTDGKLGEVGKVGAELPVSRRSSGRESTLIRFDIGTGGRNRRADRGRDATYAKRVAGFVDGLEERGFAGCMLACRGSISIWGAFQECSFSLRKLRRLDCVFSAGNGGRQRINRRHVRAIRTRTADLVDISRMPVSSALQ